MPRPRRTTPTTVSGCADERLGAGQQQVSGYDGVTRARARGERALASTAHAQGTTGFALRAVAAGTAASSSPAAGARDARDAGRRGVSNDGRADGRSLETRRGPGAGQRAPSSYDGSRASRSGRRYQPTMSAPCRVGHAQRSHARGARRRGVGRRRRVRRPALTLTAGRQRRSKTISAYAGATKVAGGSATSPHTEATTRAATQAGIGGALGAATVRRQRARHVRLSAAMSATSGAYDGFTLFGVSLGSDRRVVMHAARPGGAAGGAGPRTPPAWTPSRRSWSGTTRRSPSSSSASSADARRWPVRRAPGRGTRSWRPTPARAGSRPERRAGRRRRDATTGFQIALGNDRATPTGGDIGRGLQRRDAASRPGGRPVRRSPTTPAPRGSRRSKRLSRATPPRPDRPSP